MGWERFQVTVLDENTVVVEDHLPAPSSVSIDGKGLTYTALTPSDISVQEFSVQFFVAMIL